MVDAWQRSDCHGQPRIQRHRLRHRVPRRQLAFLRPHNEKNTRPASELSSIRSPAPQRDNYLDWFKTLPLWLDLGDLARRACVLARRLDENRCHRRTRFEPVQCAGPVRTSLHQERSDSTRRLRYLLKGPEISLVDLRPARRTADKDGHLSVRRPGSDGGTRNATTLREIAEMGGDFTDRRAASLIRRST